MKLTDRQQDALIELINIAFGRAAASLSSLTSRRVLLSAPTISLLTIKDLYRAFTGILPGEVATVHQIFSGSVNGSAMLVMDCAGAVALSRLMTNDRPIHGPIDESDCEILTEVGNILLNACLGTFGNILQVHISFSVPRIQVNALNSLMDSLQIGAEELQYALVVSTSFNLRDSAVGGYLVLVLGVSSLDRLIEAVEKLG